MSATEQLEPRFPDLDENKVRSFVTYEVLIKALTEFLDQGDGIRAKPVFSEDVFPDSPVVDSTVINMIRFISTAFGQTRGVEALKIVDRLQEDNASKRTIRFRSKHPLFYQNEIRFKNLCLVSGMVHLGIPILPYFNGVSVMESESDVDKYWELIRGENRDLF